MRYVIGDIHGQAKPTKILIDKILPLQPNDDLIFVGDYVDRGSETKELIDYLIKLKNRYRCIFLMGNHEDLMRASLDPTNYKSILDYGEKYKYSNIYEIWLRNGGYNTLESYRLDTSSRWKKLPLQHRLFFEGLKLYHEFDDWYIVHAALTNQTPKKESEINPYTLIWYRYGRDMNLEYTLPRNLIHGHTPSFQGVTITNLKNNFKVVCVDTGCGKGGLLSAYCLEDGRVWSV